MMNAIQAKEALEKMLNMLKQQEVVEAMNASKKAAGGDINKIMELIIPKVYEIQGTVMADYGFTPNDDGFADFAENLQKCEAESDEVKQLGDEFKAHMKELTKTL